MSELPSAWCQLLGTYDPAWPVHLRTFQPPVYRAKRETTPVGADRTVFIEGTVLNVPSVREGSTALNTRQPFDHGGHLIAARFGGPTCPENLVPMHGGINMRGGRWSNMEDDIGRQLGNAKGTLRVSVAYATETELRPERFMVELIAPTGRHHLWAFDNFGPYMSDPRDPEHWRARVLEELKRRSWTISAAVRQRLLSCKDAAQLERLHAALQLAKMPAPAFTSVGL